MVEERGARATEAEQAAWAARKRSQRDRRRNREGRQESTSQPRKQPEERKEAAREKRESGQQQERGPRPQVSEVVGEGQRPRMRAACGIVGSLGTKMRARSRKGTRTWAQDRGKAGVQERNGW